MGAGDIADCGPGAVATAALLDNTPGTVFTLGDNAYPYGSTSDFLNCYDPTWGRHKSRTRPAAGNHEYYTDGASGYYEYFGDAAGDLTLGYYSYDIGAWHVIVLNTNCDAIGGCASGSPQLNWLEADLAAHDSLCTLVIGHEPRFSSGPNGSTIAMGPVWLILYKAGVDLVLSGHDHDYERFAPQDPTGNLDPYRGIRQFIVGTGGRSHYSMATKLANSQVFNGDTYGILKLTLRPRGYDWEFIPETGKSFSDSGSDTCH